MCDNRTCQDGGNINRTGAGAAAAAAAAGTGAGADAISTRPHL